MKDVNTEYKIMSSPQVLCVEAVSRKDMKKGDGPRIRKRSLEDSDRQNRVKEPRMTTNKRKTGSRYYDTTNVKNKNKSKKTKRASQENGDNARKKKPKRK